MTTGRDLLLSSSAQTSVILLWKAHPENITCHPTLQLSSFLPSPPRTPPELAQASGREADGSEVCLGL